MKVARLKYFMVTAEELSFSKAARRLGIGQPSLSRAIKELEREVGAQLFTRNTNRVTLTDIGELILPKVDEALLLIEETFRDIQEFAVGKDGRLNIGYLPILLNAFLSDALETFRQTTPGIAVYPAEMSPTQQKAALRAGELDICFTKLFTSEEMDPDFDYFELFGVDVCAVVSSKDALARYDELEISAFKDRRLVGYSLTEFPECDVEFRKVFKDNAMRHDPLVRANSIQNALTAIDAGRSFALMPFVKGESICNGLKVIRLNPSVSSMCFYGVVLRDEKRKSVLSFLQECRRIGRMNVESGVDRDAATIR
ncbi:MAG: LysR family transcriptional regulator [Opitutales bacterium]